MDSLNSIFTLKTNMKKICIYFTSAFFSKLQYIGVYRKREEEERGGEKYIWEEAE